MRFFLISIQIKFKNLIFSSSFLCVCYSLDELGDARNTISELTRRYHELEIELRRLENERDELTAAYKEAEAVRIREHYSFS